MFRLSFDLRSISILLRTSGEEKSNRLCHWSQLCWFYHLVDREATARWPMVTFTSFLAHQLLLFLWLLLRNRMDVWLFGIFVYERGEPGLADIRPQEAEDYMTRSSMIGTLGQILFSWSSWVEWGGRGMQQAWGTGWVSKEFWWTDLKKRTTSKT